jgi:hypothetical protein
MSAVHFVAQVTRVMCSMKSDRVVDNPGRMTPLCGCRGLGCRIFSRATGRGDVVMSTRRICNVQKTGTHRDTHNTGPHEDDGADEVRRTLWLGGSCSNFNSWMRPTMVQEIIVAGDTAVGLVFTPSSLYYL